MHANYANKRQEFLFLISIIRKICILASVIMLEDIEKSLYKEEVSEREKAKLVDSATKKPELKDRKISGWDSGGNNEEGDFFDWVKKYKKEIKWIFGAGGLVMLAIFGYLLFQIFTFSGISLALDKPDEVMVGIPFEIIVSYSNNSPSILSGVKLSLSLPQELKFVDELSSRRVKAEDVGVLGVGTIGQKIFKVIAVSGESSAKDVTATFEYNTAGIDSRFEKSVNEEIYIGKSAASLDMVHADQVLSNETFDLTVKYGNESTETLKNLELRLAYPANFTFKNGSVNPDQGDNIWRLGDLKPGSSNEIVVRGSVVAQADSFFEIKASLISNAGDNEFSVGEKTSSISISSPPLSLALSLNNSSNHIAKKEEDLNYTINFTNTSDVGFQDAIITAKLTGEMFDFVSVDPAINFNSLTNTLTWNKSQLRELGLIPPGTSGSVTFRIRTKKDFPISRLNDRDFTLKVDARIESPTVPSNVAADETVSIARMETKVSGFIKVDALGFFRDAESGILNQGSVPPRVNQPTQYTVHWILSNFATDVTDVELRAFLKPGVRATGVIKSNIETQPVYNERTQEIIWNIPAIQATRGVLGEPVQAIFQIEALPSVNLLGHTMPLVGETYLKATDMFTNLGLNYTAAVIDTSLNNNDPTIAPEEGKVAQ